MTVTGNVGTDGDDVMIAIPQPVGLSADSKGGNDVVCIRPSQAPTPFSVWVDAGPGDDMVVNESDLGVPEAVGGSFLVELGLGADTYVGMDAVAFGGPGAVAPTETVWASVRNSHVSELENSVDTEVDTIDTRGGPDRVLTGSTVPGATNPDVIRTGSGDDEVHWAGVQTGPALVLGSGDGDEDTLHLYSGWQVKAVDVDARARVVTGDTRPLLRWEGNVTGFDLRLGVADQRFTGTKADEELVVAPPTPRVPGPYAPPGSVAEPTMPAAAVTHREIRMRGGDDTVNDYSFGPGRVDGGAGRDIFRGASCVDARIQLGDTYRCTTAASTTEQSHEYVFGFSGWEDLLLEGHTVAVTGTSADEKMKVVADRSVIRGRGGDDVLNASAVVAGVSAPAAVVSGGAGNDRLVGTNLADVLRGGPGRDQMYGERGDDHLAGGRGRDKAVGQDDIDRCVAEVRKECEA